MFVHENAGIKVFSDAGVLRDTCLEELINSIFYLERETQAYSRLVSNYLHMYCTYEGNTDKGFKLTLKYN